MPYLDKLDVEGMKMALYADTTNGNTGLQEAYSLVLQGLLNAGPSEKLVITSLKVSAILNHVIYVQKGLQCVIFRLLMTQNEMI